MALPHHQTVAMQPAELRGLQGYSQRLRLLAVGYWQHDAKMHLMRLGDHLNA